MKFAPKSENEIASANLWPIGEYDFEVNTAVEGQSKAGNDMVTLTVHVYNQEGQYRTVYDYLVDTEGAAYKIRHFAEATGMLEEYESGQLSADDMPGKTGRCKLGVQKDRSGQYPDKNSVTDYLKAKTATAGRKISPRKEKTVHAGEDSDLSDEIPF